MLPKPRTFAKKGKSKIIAVSQVIVDVDESNTAAASKVADLAQFWEIGADTKVPGQSEVVQVVG